MDELRFEHEPIVQGGTLIVSDIHLGSPLSRARELSELLQCRKPRRVIINGDLIDDYDFSNFDASHWKLLSQIRELAKKIEVVWVLGNHDMQQGVYVLGEMLGVTVTNVYEWEQRINGTWKRCLAIHGHQFDTFMDQNQFISSFADICYRLLQSHAGLTRKFLRYLKKTSKRWIRNSQCVREGAIAFAFERNSEIVCCGHTHAPEFLNVLETDILYLNTGDWVHEATFAVLNDYDIPRLLRLTSVKKNDNPILLHQ